MSRNFAAIIIGAIVVLVVLNFTFYTVDQRKQAIVLQLGEIVGVEKKPGLYA